MDLLRSSILGKEFINYRRYTTERERKRFYLNTTNIKKIPVIVDTVDKELTDIFRKKKFINRERIITYGLELQMNEDMNINDIIKEIKIELIKSNNEHIFVENDIKIGTEDGYILCKNDIIKDLYQRHTNKDDKILYLLITKEKSMYNYIMSIIRSIIGYIY